MRRGGGRGYEYANHVTTWNLVMTGKYSRHISLCRGHCLMRAAGTMFPSFHSFSLSLSRSLSRSLSVLLFFMCSLSLSLTLSFTQFPFFFFATLSVSSFFAILSLSLTSLSPCHFSTTLTELQPGTKIAGARLGSPAQCQTYTHTHTAADTHRHTQRTHLNKHHHCVTKRDVCRSFLKL